MFTGLKTTVELTIYGSKEIKDGGHCTSPEVNVLEGKYANLEDYREAYIQWPFRRC